MPAKKTKKTTKKETLLTDSVRMVKLETALVQVMVKCVLYATENPSQAVAFEDIKMIADNALNEV